jgi:DNA-directed RNA polymerase specialized sigma24 family protein/CheY-like chemotaxis protein
MAISEQIAPHLPYLRRYARALTGRQTSGDAYVVELLEALIADPSIIRGDLHARLALYSTFTKLWSSVRLNNAPPVPADPAQPPVDQRLAELSPLPRQAFLLHTVEDFSLDEVATILGITKAKAAALIEEANRTFAEQVATDVLIIEDEPIIAMDLEQIVTSLGHRVQAIARTHSQALKAVKERYPGLVLADIQLADGSSGIDAVNDLLDSFEVPVIFITAYPERLLTGERPEPAFLITKPFQAEMVKAIISQALFFDQKSHSPRKAPAFGS